MTLNYLDFDYSEDTEGVGAFEAMASTGPEQVAAVRAELAAVLDWAFASFPERGAIGEGGEWDYELRGLLETSVPQALVYDERTRHFSVEAGQAGRPRHTVILSISGTPAFCAAFREQFAID